MQRLVASLALSCALVAPAFAADTDATVVINNGSSWALHHLYISSVDTQEWGPDQLGDAVIANGQEFTLNNVPCDAYDVKVVDEDGDECVINAVALCVDSDKWTVTDDDLLGCQAATKESE